MTHVEVVGSRGGGHYACGRVGFERRADVIDLNLGHLEIGVDIVNRIQVAAADMDPRELKRDFGKDLAFWGRGCDMHTYPICG